jgi:hypothetical protein
VKYAALTFRLCKRFVISTVLVLILGTAAAACSKPATLEPSISSPPLEATSENTTQVPDQILSTGSPLEQEGWQTIQTFTGQESLITAPFQIHGIKWRFSWTVDTANPAYASFSVFVYPNKTGSLPIRQISYSQEGSGSETIYVSSGSRDYYIKVIAANVKNWTITVDDYVAEKPSTSISPVQIIYIKYHGKVYPPDPENGLCYTRIEPDEYIEIKNTSNEPQDIRGWVLTNITKGYIKFTFPAFFPRTEGEYMEPTILKPYETVRVYTDEINNESGGFSFNFGTGNYWNNEIPDTAVLFNTEGKEMSRKSYTVRTDNNN